MKIEKQDCAFWRAGECNACKDVCRYSTEKSTSATPANARAVAEGESRWLIERTYAKGHPAERREFWLGVTRGDIHQDSFDADGYVWTKDALAAARFSTKEIAGTLRYRHFHPEADVEVCEHLFQCGMTTLPQPVGTIEAGLIAAGIAKKAPQPARQRSEPISGVDWEWCEDCDHGIRGGKPCESCGGTGRMLLVDLLKATQQHVKELKAQLAPLSEKPAIPENLLMRWHDQLGNMIDQVGHPDYSLHEMVAGMRRIRTEMLVAALSHAPRS